ncbi:MAG TPA: isoprenylcysteine carboxylmethyltransferase family protein [Planctomycetota bacterium]
MIAAERLPREIPPLWLAVALLVMGALHTQLPVLTLMHWPWSLLGFVVIAASTLLMLVCLWQFHRAKTGIRPFTPAHQLVVGGAYRFTRNPMYLGLIGVSLGVAIRLGTVSALCVPPLFFLVLDRRFVRREEVFLRERFGAAFEDYCRRVRRWL